jgi:hypothetical protein
MSTHISVPPQLLLERILTLEIVRVTERAAVSSARLRGHGKDKASDQAAVEALGHIDCGPTSTIGSRAICQTQAYGPGLSLDLANGRVTRIWLVERTN